MEARTVANGPSEQDLDARFRYHAPTPAARELHEMITEETLRLAKLLRVLVPDSRGLSVALTKLEEVRMWANQAIATNHDKLR